MGWCYSVTHWCYTVTVTVYPSTLVHNSITLQRYIMSVPTFTSESRSRSVSSPWSKWTANSDKKLNVNKPCMTSQKTVFRLQKWHLAGTCTVHIPLCKFSKYFTKFNSNFFEIIFEMFRYNFREFPKYFSKFLNKIILVVSEIIFKILKSFLNNSWKFQKN